ncbi:TetR/AcrR family transcriptional regulator [Arthrobacter burdickii]|uniref:TetR/AcrR family transcriptional regulator n=1 Tax=Arthrobacter burdickii TaxID=3035920 RepID=A0ABT8JZD7_9MICC|nr:TetR/AcrR family transcriptional regulator [Arthrobacter burdickii]MDN4609509.1 TetR/AcrR family transcriptional regulator [Arthrobacter burdickii]
MATKEDWIVEALRVLAAQGPSHVTIDRLAGNLDLSKGSFYHHFKSLAVFRQEILAHYEWESTTSLIASVEKREPQDPLLKIEWLVDLAIEPSSQAGLQIAVRAWAAQDPEVSKVQERLDRTRLDYASTLWREAGCHPQEADFRAKSLYLLIIGGRQVTPPLPLEELRRICRRAIAAFQDEPLGGERP